MESATLDRCASLSPPISGNRIFRYDISMSLMRSSMQSTFVASIDLYQVIRLHGPGNASACSPSDRSLTVAPEGGAAHAVEEPVSGGDVRVRFRTGSALVR